MTTNFLLLFASIGMVATAMVLNVIIKDLINIQKRRNEANKFDLPEINDIPNWQPMTPIQKRSNKILKQMYKGSAKNEH